MKLWLPGLALLAASAAAQADNYRIVHSPSQKLDVWIDNLKDNQLQSWCGKALAVRIVDNGDKDVTALNIFMPRLGALLAQQCAPLQQLNWKLVDTQQALIAQGRAARASGWTAQVTPAPQSAPQSAVAGWVAPTGRAEDLSPPADRAPWQEFTLQDGCRLRTYWRDDGRGTALFIPASGDAACEKGGWLNGRSLIARNGDGVETQTAVTFVHGFPVVGLNERADVGKLLITSVNNQRMVLSSDAAEKSWLILPYDPALNGWRSDGVVAVEVSRDLLNDAAGLRARLEQARALWTPWLAAETPLNVLPIDTLHPQLRDPAASAWRAAQQ